MPAITDVEMHKTELRLAGIKVCQCAGCPEPVSCAFTHPETTKGRFCTYCYHWMVQHMNDFEYMHTPYQNWICRCPQN